MADLEYQIRALADRRFAATEPVPFAPGTQPADGTTVRSIATKEAAVERTEIIMRSNDTARPPRRWLVLGSAAAVAALAVVGVALVTGDDDPSPAATTLASDPPPTPPPTLPPVDTIPELLQGADGNAEAVAAFEAVVEAIDAFNRGDGPAWVAARMAAGPPQSGSNENVIAYVEAAAAAGARYEMSSCEYEGFGESMGVLSDVEGHRFRCATTMVDEFTVAAGLDYDEEFLWTVADGRVIDAESNNQDRTILGNFMDELWLWMNSEHPDTPFERLGFYRYPAAAEVPGVLDLVDDFVEAKEHWPLTDG